MASTGSRVRSGFDVARCSGARPFRDHAVLPKRWRTYARVGVGCTRRPPRRRSVAAVMSMSSPLLRPIRSPGFQSRRLETKGPRSIPSESTRRKRKGIATWVPGCGRLLALRQSGRYSRADALNRPPTPRPAWVTALVTGCKHLVKADSQSFCPERPLPGGCRERVAVRWTRG